MGPAMRQLMNEKSGFLDINGTFWAFFMKKYRKNAFFFKNILLLKIKALSLQKILKSNIL